MLLMPYWMGTCTIGYIIQCWDGLSKYMCKRLFHFLLGIQFFNFLKQGVKLKAWVSRHIQDSFWLQVPDLSSRGGFKDTKVSQKCSYFCINYWPKMPVTLSYIWYNNGITGILEGVWPVNNPKKVWLRDFRCPKKSGITKFLKYLHYSIYKPSQ